MGKIHLPGKTKQSDIEKKSHENKPKEINQQLTFRFLGLKKFNKTKTSQVIEEENNRSHIPWKKENHVEIIKVESFWCPHQPIRKKEKTKQ